MNRVVGNPRGDKLPAKRGVKVDRDTAQGRLPDVACRRSASGFEGGQDILPDFVATPEDRRSQRDDEVTGGDPFGPEPSHGVRPDSGGDPPPTCVEGRDRGRVPIHEQDGNAVGGSHHRDGAWRAAPNGTDRPVGRRWARPWRFSVDDDATVHLPKRRWFRRSESRRAQENGTTSPRGADVVSDQSEIEVRTSEGKPRAERMGHPGNHVEGRAPRERHASDLLEAPPEAGHVPAYFDDERLLIVALISAASFARGSRSTYF